MKIILIFLSLFISLNLHAELTPLEVVIKQGLQVRMGELTGAGSKVSVNNLAGLILPEGVVLKRNCQSITIKPSNDPKVSDIVKITFLEQEIEASEFIGFVTK